MIDLPPDAALIADTPRLRLVPATVENTNELFLLLNDQRLHDHTGGTPLGEAEIADRLRRWQDRRSTGGHELVVGWIVRLVPLGEAIGEVSAIVSVDESALLTWVIGRRWQGHGFATEAAFALVRLLEAHTGVRRIQAQIPVGHKAARRVAAHLGMEPTGERRGRLELWEGEATPVVDAIGSADAAASRSTVA